MPPSLVEYANNRDLARTYENQVLYKMCIDTPHHDDAAVNAGKIIIIGRTYAASPQRGAGKASNSKDDFFNEMGKALQKSDIDVRLEQIDSSLRFNQAMLPAVVKAHEFLVSLLLEATRHWAEDGGTPREQQSFASKYLHFHRPNAFPIMDGRAKAGLRRHRFRGAYSSYDRFCAGILRFAETQPVDWTLRGIDGLLLGANR